MRPAFKLSSVSLAFLPQKLSSRHSLLLLLSLLASCGGGEGGGSAVTPPPPPPPPVTTTSVIVAPSTLGLTGVGVTGQLSATVTTSAGVAAAPTVTWTSSNPSIATVAGTGTTATVTSVAPGSAQITASSGGQSGSATVTVTPPVTVTAVTVAPATLSLTGLGVTGQLTATVTTSAGVASAPTVTWTSSNPSIATVAGTGTTATVTSVAPGSAQITASAGGQSGVAAVTVVPPLQTLTITLAGEGTGTVTSTPTGLTCSALTCTGAFPFGTTVTVTPVPAAGSALDAWSGACTGTAACTVTMGQAQAITARFRRLPARIASITLTPATVNVDEGESVQLNAVARDSAGNVLPDRALAWSSSDTLSAVVSSTGRVTARTEADTVTITVTGEGVVGRARLKVRSLFLLATEVSAGTGFTCAIRLAQGAWCWGDNRSGELGNPSAAFGSMTAVTGGTAFVQIAAGSNHTCGRTAPGDLFCWGYNREGQTGDSLRSFPGTGVPQRVVGGRQYASVVRGWGAMCALTGAGTAYCWGFGGGQLGVTAASSTVSIPSLVVGGIQWQRLSAAGIFVCGIARDNAAYCWGNAPAANTSVGRIGDGARTSRTAPSPLVGAPRYRDIATGGGMACGIDLAGDAWCWGANNRGQLGTGDFVNTDRPVRVQSALKFTSIVAGDSHVCALTAEGVAWCWGDARSAQLGDGSTTTFSAVPVATQQGSARFVSLSAGEYHTCALATDRRVFCWGWNSSGQLGAAPGGTVNRPLPVPRPER